MILSNTVFRALVHSPTSNIYILRLKRFLLFKTLVDLGTPDFTFLLSNGVVARTTAMTS